MKCFYDKSSEMYQSVDIKTGIREQFNAVSRRTMETCKTQVSEGGKEGGQKGVSVLSKSYGKVLV